MAPLSNPSNHLDTSWQAIRLRWQETCRVWLDEVQREFEKDFWTPLEQQVPATRRELERLAQVIAQAQRSIK